MSRTQNKQLSRIAQNAGILNQEFKILNLKSVYACSGFQSQNLEKPVFIINMQSAFDILTNRDVSKSSNDFLFLI